MKRRYNFIINPEYNGYTIEDFLTQLLPQFSRHTINKLIHNDIIKINQREAHKNQRIKTDNRVTILLPKNNTTYLTEPIKIEVLYEDKGFLVVNKPPHIPVIAERWSRETIFKDAVRAHINEEHVSPRTVHRIDKEATGIVIVAKNKKWERYFGSLFRNRKIQKKYLALVAGTPLDSGTINHPIKQASNKSTRMMIDDSGKKSTTHFKVVEFFRDFALVEVSIESGRTHQIRVHMASQGNPLAVDSIYGYRTSIKLSDIKDSYQGKMDIIEKPIISRLTLHAEEVTFFHPDKKENITISAPLFKDFSIVLKKLRKYRS